jgi:tripartite-type tricarboxylate transporter receptor subunit TctC
MLARREFALAIAWAMTVAAFAAPACAQTYPTRIIKMIVPFSPGGQPDTIARLVSQHLSTTIGTVIIDNRPGANGIIAAKAAAASEADGHTLLFGSTTTLAIAPALSRNPGYDPIKSFAPIAMISSAPFIMAVGPSVTSRTIGDFIAYAKANPGKLNFAAPTGGPPHLGGELFKAATGVDIVPISYRTMNQAFAELMSGQMDIIFDAPALLLPLIREGKVRALVTLNASRTPDLPDVPTMAEAGLPDVRVTVWNGLVTPAGTPPQLINRLNAATNEWLRSAEMKRLLANFGSVPMIGTPQEFADFIAVEAKKWAETVRIAGVQVD